MDGAKRLVWRQATLGDAAVDGLLAGLGAGVAMAIILAAAGMITGDTPSGLFARFDPSERAQPVVGVLMHLAVAGVYGMLFGILWWLVRRHISLGLRTLGLGLTYSMGLFILAETVLLPSAASPLLSIPMWSFGLAHVVYGMTLSRLMGRSVA